MKANYVVHSCAPTKLVKQVDIGDGTIADAAYDGLIIELVPTDEHPLSGTIKLAVNGRPDQVTDTFSEGAAVTATFKVAKEG